MVHFTFIMFFVWLAAMMIACWSVEVARMFARRMAKQARDARSESPAHGAPVLQNGQRTTDNGQRLISAPQAAVILPIKGVDEDTRENIRALFCQDYARARFLFAVESDSDPVIPLIEELTRDFSQSQIEIVVAGVATSRGQKIHNQLAAIDRTTSADEILAFIDADARPNPQWLGALVAPLGEPDIGATTGFRFYIPANTAQGSHLSNIMVSIINAAVAALLGPGWRNLVWGGSMAIRRENFLAFGVQSAWQNAVSDDYVLSYCVKRQSKRRIQFVQQCLVASDASFNWHGFFEFAARQYRITKVCAPWVWLAATGAALLYLAGLFYTLFFWLIFLAAGNPDHNLLIMFVALYGAQVIRGYLLFRGGMHAFPESAGRLRACTFWYTLGYPFSLAVNLWALFRSAWGRTITWRGVHYTMLNRMRTRIHRAPSSANISSSKPQVAEVT